jgi:hypothetical protein
MRTLHFFVALILLVSAASAGDDPAALSNLQPELQQALLHDAACSKPAASDSENLMSVPVKTEEIRVGGREAGVIASPQDACHCENQNCSTYVYLRSGESYKLALENSFASLRPMKIIKHGLPSLSGKLQVSDSQEETTIYDWDGHSYEPSLCATVTQRKNSRLPAIAHHACGTGARLSARR